MEKNFMSSKEKNITFYQVWEWIQKNRAIVLAIIPLLGSLLMGIMRVAFRYYIECKINIETENYIKEDKKISSFDGICSFGDLNCGKCINFAG